MNAVHKILHSQSLDSIVLKYDLVFAFRGEFFSVHVWNLSVVNTTVSSSRSIFGYCFSASMRLLEAYAIGFLS